jgi:Cu/Ag efflux protein CusF
LFAANHKQERAMKAARITLATVAALAWSLPALAAEQGGTGVVTGINRLNGTVAIKRVQDGTVGANTPAAAAEEFKIKDNAMIENVHAGDRVTFSTADGSGTKTIIKLDRQK